MIKVNYALLFSQKGVKLNLKLRGKVMLKMFSKALSILAEGTEAANAVDPLYNAITLIGPYAMGIVAALGLIYGVIVGVRFARAEDPSARAALQKVLINGVIGFVAVLIRGPLVEWMNS